MKRGPGGGCFIKYHSHTLFTVVISDDEVQAKKEGPRHRFQKSEEGWIQCTAIHQCGITSSYLGIYLLCWSNEELLLLYTLSISYRQKARLQSITQSQERRWQRPHSLGRGSGLGGHLLPAAAIAPALAARGGTPVASAATVPSTGMATVAAVGAVAAVVAAGPAALVVSAAPGVVVAAAVMARPAIVVVAAAVGVAAAAIVAAAAAIVAAAAPVDQFVDDPAIGDQNALFGRGRSITLGVGVGAVVTRTSALAVGAAVAAVGAGPVAVAGAVDGPGAAGVVVVGGRLLPVARVIVAVAVIRLIAVAARAAVVAAVVTAVVVAAVVAVAVIVVGHVAGCIGGCAAGNLGLRRGRDRKHRAGKQRQHGHDLLELHRCEIRGLVVCG